jgi:hypothetical protein
MSSTWVKSQREDGIKPVIEFLETSSLLKKTVSLPSELGIDPVSEFCCTNKLFNILISPTPLGSVPTNLFVLKAKYSRLVILIIVSGICPENELGDKFNVSTFVKSPMLDGNVPNKSLLCN